MSKLTYPRAQALQNPETAATVIHAILLEKYGEQVYDWDPVTVYLETKADFNADMCTEAMDRWSAIQVIMTSDAFFKRLDAFLALCNALSDGDPFFSSFNPVSVEEAGWALAEVALNREMLPFSYAIKGYLKQVLKEEGFSEGTYPDIFKEVFTDNPSSEDIRDGLAELNNSENLDKFIDEQLADIVHQFDQIPDMDNLDKLIFDKGVAAAVATLD